MIENELLKSSFNFTWHMKHLVHVLDTGYKCICYDPEMQLDEVEMAPGYVRDLL